MKKTYILDTSVLLHDPCALEAFADNDIVLPITVLEELDSFKDELNKRGFAAREVTRLLGELGGMNLQSGAMQDGVSLGTGLGKLRVSIKNGSVPPGLSRDKNDNHILQIALTVKKEIDTTRPAEKAVLVSKDINMRIKALALGMLAEDYKTKKVKTDNLWPGWKEVNISDSEIDRFYKEKALTLAGDWLVNEFAVLKAPGGGSAIAKYSVKTKTLVPLFHQQASPWGIKPLNVEQRFALELLLSEDVDLVTLVGKAGCGKTLLALACGLQKVIDEKKYRKLFACRPIIPMGRDIGFLPGSKEEKLEQWMGAINDNLEFLMERGDRGEKGESGDVQYLYENHVETEALTYIRGRSLPRLFMVVDDAQNLTPHEVKTIITRAGEGTKLVFTGDPYQIDNPYLDTASNGLSYLIDRLKGDALYGNVMFKKVERSRLAAIGNDKL